MQIGAEQKEEQRKRAQKGENLGLVQEQGERWGGTTWALWGTVRLDVDRKVGPDLVELEPL